MKAAALRYHKAGSLAEVHHLLERYGEDARILAGGQSLVAALNLRLSAPAVLIDINGLPDLAGVTVGASAVAVGALTRQRTLERSSEIALHLPLVAQAMPHVAHAAIRNRGTLGGSIAYADPAAELPACSVALDAQLVLASRDGERRTPARGFFKGLYETDLRPGEVLVRAEFPRRDPDYRSVFLELARRHGDYAVAGVAMHGAVRDGRLSDVSVVFFGVGTVPVLAHSAGAALEGERTSSGLEAALAAAVADDLDPLPDLYHSAATKLHLAQVLAARALAALAAPEA